jgi:poly-gamma-glutamate synthesis protein (capsule biosynthesis protein)
VSQVFLAVGDLAMDREAYDESFAATRDLLTGGRHRLRADRDELRVEGRPPAAGAPRRSWRAPMAPPRWAARASTWCRWPGNHVLDWGNDAFFETKANLEAAGRARLSVLART